MAPVRPAKSLAIQHNVQQVLGESELVCASTFYAKRELQTARAR